MVFKKEKKLEDNEEITDSSSQLLGAVGGVCEKCEEVKKKTPPPNHVEADFIPQDQEIIGLEGYGYADKGTFVIPLLQALKEMSQKSFLLVLVCGRSSAVYVGQEFATLGSSMGLKTTVIDEEMDKTRQTLALSKKPDIIIATTKGLMYHLENTKEFDLKDLKFLIMDELRMLFGLHYEQNVHKILQAIKQLKKIYLYTSSLLEVQNLKKKKSNIMEDFLSERYPFPRYYAARIQAGKNQPQNHLIGKLQEYLHISLAYEDTCFEHTLSDLPDGAVLLFCTKGFAAQKMISLMDGSFIPKICKVTLDSDGHCIFKTDTAVQTQIVPSWKTFYMNELTLEDRVLFIIMCFLYLFSLSCITSSMVNYQIFGIFLFGITSLIYWYHFEPYLHWFTAKKETQMLSKQFQKRAFPNLV